MTAPRYKNLLPLGMLQKRLQGLEQGVDELAANVIEVWQGKQA
jgi:hypothetical protein